MTRELTLNVPTGIPAIVPYPEQLETLRQAFSQVVTEIVKHAPGVTAAATINDTGQILAFEVHVAVEPLRACMCDGGGGIAHIRSDRCTSGS